MDKIEGFLEVGANDNDEVVINHPDLKRDEHGIAHIVFSPNQARHLASLLNKHAWEADASALKKQEAAAVAARVKAAAIPVDESARVLIGEKPIPEDGSHREIDPKTGMQKEYVVLNAAERAKGFVRPVRNSYKHLKCGMITRMVQEIAETYARAPGYYSHTFCSTCRNHYPVGENGEFVWDGTNEKVGT